MRLTGSAEQLRAHKNLLAIIGFHPIRRERSNLATIYNDAGHFKSSFRRRGLMVLSRPLALELPDDLLFLIAGA